MGIIAKVGGALQMLYCGRSEIAIGADCNPCS
jgi:hypothetical protein